MTSVFNVRRTMRLLRTDARARRRGQQTCKSCGRPQDEIDFVTSSITWQLVVPEELGQRSLCLVCFCDMARKRNIHVVKVFLADGP